ncbi:MAG: TetR/AcrR family transcriptional regulator [Spirochaetaceae bacterium]|nr:TetR/AcrR family transcriptional regulator [Spirochaetaceae bacterium]
MSDQDKSTEVGPEVDTKTRILDAAEAIIRQHGIQALSLRAIAARTGLTAPAAYRHFSGKEEILHAVIRRGYEKFQEGLARAREGLRTPDALLRASLRYYLLHWAQDPVSFFLMMEVNHDLGHLSVAAIRQGSFGDLPAMVERYAQDVHGRELHGEGLGAGPHELDLATRFLASGLQGIAMGLIAELKAGKESSQQVSVSIERAVEFLCGALSAFFTQAKGEQK